MAFIPKEERFRSESIVTSYKQVVYEKMFNVHLYRPVAYESDKSKLNDRSSGFGFGKRSDFTYMPHLL